MSLKSSSSCSEISIDEIHTRDEPGKLSEFMFRCVATGAQCTSSSEKHPVSMTVSDKVLVRSLHRILIGVSDKEGTTFDIVAYAYATSYAH